MSRIRRLGLSAATVAGLVVFLVWLGKSAYDRVLGNVPMVLQGRVVDQAGNGIPGVELEISGSARTWRSWVPLPGEREFEWTVRGGTRDDGSFTIPVGNGFSAGFRGISKPGYTVALGNRTGYSFGPAEDRPTGADQPVSLMMWNEALRKVVSRTCTACKLHSGVDYELSYERGTIEPAQGLLGDITFCLTFTRNPVAGHLHTAALFTLLQGEITPAPADAPLVAPEKGYQPACAFTFDEEKPGVSGVTDRMFYTRSKDGLRFARVHAHIEVRPDGKSACLTCEYVASFDGSRVLDLSRSVKSN